MRPLLAPVLILALALPAAALAQQSREGTLADIRQELSVLLFQINELRRELNTTQGAPLGGVGGGSVLERVDAMEAELRRLTSRTEELGNRVESIAADGTNRIGDLEFRLRELEGGDLGAIEPTPPLGGEPPQGAAGGFGAVPLPAPLNGGGGSAPATDQLAVGEQDDFDRARAAFDEGDYAEAAERFTRFNETYYGGPLATDAYFLRGESYNRMGDRSQAARAYLDAFNASPDGPRAAEALIRLGGELAALGQRDEACLMLAEVGSRFPASPMVSEANAVRQGLSCP